MRAPLLGFLLLPWAFQVVVPATGSPSPDEGWPQHEFRLVEGLWLPTEDPADSRRPTHAPRTRVPAGDETVPDPPLAGTSPRPDAPRSRASGFASAGGPDGVPGVSTPGTPRAPPLASLP